MPTLQELKDRWFITLDGGVPDGIPNRRHTDDAEAGDNALEVSTDGNTVALLIDGLAYMKQWHDDLLALHSQPGAEVYHAAWRLENVFPEGLRVSTHGALDDLIAAKATGGVATYVLTSAHTFSLHYNRPTVARLRLNGVWTACRDERFPANGSNHHKVVVLKHDGRVSAVVGSIDLSTTRWDRPAHAPIDADRPDAPTHDTGVLVEGPALADLERCYRERWNDSTRTFGMRPVLPPQPLITTQLSSAPATGTHSVQVLRTYGITSTLLGYSWSPRGEFSAWAAYLNAIEQAHTYIYIEDQYFLPFAWPPCYDRLGPGGISTVARDTDIVYQLGEAMKRGVRVAVVTPNNSEDPGHWFIKYQRDVGVNYLRGIKTAGATGDVVVAGLQSGPGLGSGDVYVHSKLMLVDDEVMFIGSNNVNQRSMTHDGELHLAIVDGANLLVKQSRKDIWAEHTGRSAGLLDDPVTAYDSFFVPDTVASHGHLTPYRFDPDHVYPPRPGSKPPPKGHAFALHNVVDPYAGPPGLR